MRRWLQRGAAGMVAMIWMLAGWAFWVEPRQLMVRQVSVDVEGLEGPVRLLMIGDLQPAGPHETPARLDAMMDRLASLDVDAVVWVGDLVSERRLSTSFTHPEDTARAMGRLTAPQLAVLGNHDWWWDGRRMAQLLRDQGIDVLTNEHRVLQVRGQQVVIAGVDDPVTGHDDLTAALAGIAPDAVTVLLSHTPDLFPQVPAHVDLMLAGHTHCGQVTVPGLGRPMVPSHFGQRYAAGLVVEGGHQLYVTCGIGTAVMPVRFGNPPEVVVLTLH